MDDGRTIKPGMLLAAAPMMWDPNFRRCVILLCEHSKEGSFGLIINRPLPFHSEELDGMLAGQSPALSFGGPVQPTSLHYLHDEAHAIPDSTEIVPGVYWGGDFDQVQQLAQSTPLAELKIRFFLGYSGWGHDQLVSEVDNNDWIPAPVSSDLLFELDADHAWGTVLERLGGHFALLANFPADPRMN